jgi:uncharacterized lipoprotein YmbA
MRKAVLTRSAGLLGAVLLGLTSCSSPPTRFYVLSHLPSSAQPSTAAEQGLAIGVGPVQLPDYLDRPQIVTRSSDNELKLANFAQWAESLQDNFAQVLADNLAILLPTRQVPVFPWSRTTPIDYQVKVKVIRFDRTAGGESVLNARWSIISGDGSRALIVRESSYSVLPEGDDHAATVAAMNQTLALFSRDIAAALRGLPRSSR